jgi:hypothetical protein
MRAKVCYKSHKALILAHIFLLNAEVSRKFFKIQFLPFQPSSKNARLN